jgi:hypothetical protein
MTTIFNIITQHGGDILQAVSGIVSGASVLANFTRTDKDDKAMGFVSRVVNFLAANFFVLAAKK